MAFDRYIGIDYSGAATPTTSLPSLRVYAADHVSPPAEVAPPPGPRKYWTRRGIAEWLAKQMSGSQRTIVGIDHAFSFPVAYFEAHGIELNWQAFLDDFQCHWPTDEDNTYVRFVRDGATGNGQARSGNTRWQRITERRAGTAKSVFHFGVQGQVATSTHAGLPWIRYLRQRVGGRTHFWPFDGWEIAAGRFAITEVYPSLWSRALPREDRSGDQHDAYSVAYWMRSADLDGTLAQFLEPALTLEERAVAKIEGWILGVA